MSKKQTSRTPVTYLDWGDDHFGAASGFLAVSGVSAFSTCSIAPLIERRLVEPASMKSVEKFVELTTLHVLGTAYRFATIEQLACHAADQPNVDGPITSNRGHLPRPGRAASASQALTLRGSLAARGSCAGSEASVLPASFGISASADLSGDGRGKSIVKTQPVPGTSRT